MANGEQATHQEGATEEEGFDADFDAGFSGVATAPTETPEGKGTTKLEQGFEGTDSNTPAATAAPAPTATPDASAAAPKKVEIDEAELAALRTRANGNGEQLAQMQRQFDKVFGQVGGLKELVTKLQTATPAGEAIELTLADMGEMATEYPEIAKQQLTVLNNALKKFKGTAAADPEAIDKVVSERLKTAREEIHTQVRSEIIDSTLNGVLPRWRQQVATPAYDAWIKTQPAEVQKLAQSDDVADAADLLRKFRGHLSKPPAPAPTPTAAPRRNEPNPRQRQIAAAVTPRGDGAATSKPATTEDDDFLAGFNGR